MSDLKSSDTKVVPLDSEGKFVLTCPGCAKRFQLLDRSIFGKRVTCKACKAPFFVDGSVVTDFKPSDMPLAKPNQSLDSSRSVDSGSEIETTVETHAPLQPALEVDSKSIRIVKSCYRFVRNFIVDCKKALAGSNTFGIRLLILLPIFVGMGLVYEHENNTRYFLLMWSLQLMLCTATGWVLACKNLRVILIFACMSPLLWIYTARNAEVKRRWQKEGISYVDSEWRYSGTVYHQYFSGKELSDLSAEGYVSESGKKHGKWTYTIVQPYFQEDQFYWYGEKVTEGEWHLRNKR